MIDAERKDVLNNIALALLATAVLLILERYLMHERKERERQEAEDERREAEDERREAEHARREAFFQQSVRDPMIHAMHEARAEEEETLEGLVSDLVERRADIYASIQGIDEGLSRVDDIGGDKELKDRLVAVGRKYRKEVKAIADKTGQTQTEVWSAIVDEVKEVEEDMMPYHIMDSDDEEEMMEAEAKERARLEEEAEKAEDARFQKEKKRLDEEDKAETGANMAAAMKYF